MINKTPESLDQNIEMVPEGKVLEYEDLDEQQIERLKEDIKEHNGLVRIFIHADWITNDYEERIKKPMLRLLRSRNSPPIFFLEDKTDFDNIKKIFGILDEDLGILAKPIYLQRTMKQRPYPIFSKSTYEGLGKYRDYDLSDENSLVETNTAMFIVSLEGLGVKKILIGGNNLVIDGKDLQQCVPSFIEKIDVLKNEGFTDMDVKVSEMTGPQRRSDLRGIRDDLI